MDYTSKPPRVVLPHGQNVVAIPIYNIGFNIGPDGHAVPGDPIGFSISPGPPCARGHRLRCDAEIVSSPRGRLPSTTRVRVGSPGRLVRRPLSSESDWERSNHSKVRNVPSNAELGRNVEQGPRPHDCAEPHINGAQNSVRVRHRKVYKVRIGKVSNVEPGRN